MEVPIVSKVPRAALLAALSLLWISTAPRAFAEGNLNKVNHVIVIVQENHSFDNYLGALAYAPGSPYHNGNGSCSFTGHYSLDGLTCALNGSSLDCTNSNINNEGGTPEAIVC
jgi:phospholipase C